MIIDPLYYNSTYEIEFTHKRQLVYNYQHRMLNKLRLIYRNSTRCNYIVLVRYTGVGCEIKLTMYCIN